MKVSDQKEKRLVDATDGVECSLPFPAWASTQKFFTHRSIEKHRENEFICSELTTGCRISSGISRDEAIAFAILKCVQKGELAFNDRVTVCLAEQATWPKPE